jgi:hypothetical protein
MIHDFQRYFNTNFTNGLIQKYVGLEGGLEVLLQTNPENQILHTGTSIDPIID